MVLRCELGANVPSGTLSTELNHYAPTVSGSLAVSQSIHTDESSPTSRLLLHSSRPSPNSKGRSFANALGWVWDPVANGKDLGRRSVVFDRARAVELHASGASVREVAKGLHTGREKVNRFLMSQNPHAEHAA